MPEAKSPRYSNWTLTRRMLALAWRYRTGCLKIILLQIVLLAMGISGLRLMGLGIDYVRYRLVSMQGAAPRSAVEPAEARQEAGSAAAVPKPPRWPFGMEPPEAWPPMSVIAAISAGIVLLALCRSALNVLYTLAATRLVQGRIVVDLRARVYDKMQRLSFRFFDANASGSIINRVTGDVQAVRSFVDGVVMQSLILALSLGVYVVYMSGVHFGLTVACLASTPLLWHATARFSRMVRPAYARNRELFDDQILVLTENMRGVHVVKGFNRQDQEERKFCRASDAVRDQKHWIFRQATTFHPLIGFIAHLNLVVMLAYGGLLVVRYELAPDAAAAARAGLSVGELLVFAGLLQQFCNQIANIGNIADSMQQSLAGAARVFEVLDTPSEIASPVPAVRLPKPRGEIVFENVTFGYKPGDEALSNISFRAEPGRCVAVIGATGSGKSTLLSLIPRFYDPAAGRITLDGHDLRALDLNDLRRGIGIVFQESFLFSNTVRANIAFGQPGASQEAVERAARVAAAHDFIMALPHGYDTVLREGGSDLSGGQRQRLAIARAILLEPALLLLDDPMASVDPHTESDILRALDNAMEGRTTFLVAHRLSTLRRADLVIVLDAGRIVQTGTHEELMRVRGHYQGAASLQIADAESLRLLGAETGAGT